MRPSYHAIAAALFCALIVWFSRPLWPSLVQLELSAPALQQAPPLTLPQLPEVPRAPLTIDDALADGEHAAHDLATRDRAPSTLIEAADDERDPWRRPLLSPVTDASLPSWSASVLARQARRSAMAELADVPAIIEETVETPVREQQPQSLTVKKPTQTKAESRAVRKQREGRQREQAKRTQREKLQLQLPPPERLLPQSAMDLTAVKGVELPDLLNPQSAPSRLEFHGRVLTNDDIGRDPIETPRNALDEIQGAELGIRIKTP